MRTHRRRRLHVFLIIGLLAAALTAITVPASAGAGDAVEPQKGAPFEALIKRYHRAEPDGSGTRLYVNDILYQPRSFENGTDADSYLYGSTLVTDPGKYEGWDILSPPNWSENRRSAWLHFTLNRRAKVGIVQFDDNAPSWLNSWTYSGNVELNYREYPVYTKTLEAGAHSLGGPSRNGSGVKSYIVLLAEENGAPTPTPDAPQGRQIPEPNTECQEWVHDQYTTIGPDGAEYETWHPQIDPVYWCYFRHHHGSDPSIIPGNPLIPYEYVADKVPQVEPDVGFKEMIFKDPRGYYVRMIDHVATGHHRRVCAQFHTVYALVYDEQGNELFRTGFKADFGATVDQDGRVPVSPTNCGYNMAAVAAGTEARKELRIGPNDHDYERWVAVPTVETANLGMIFHHRFDIQDPFSFCSNMTCNSVNTDPDRTETGTRRTFKMRNFEFDASLALATGTFYTDPYGVGLVDESAENAVQQYIKAGFRLTFEHDRYNSCNVVDPWTQKFSCNNSGSTTRVELEHGFIKTYGDGDLPNVMFNRPTCNGYVATIVGTEGDDVITGTAVDDVIVGLGGNDRIEGLEGDDIICGGDGKDKIWGGPGRDIIRGERDRDKLFGQQDIDWIFGGHGLDRIGGQGGEDVIAGQGGDDAIKGLKGDDLLLGGPGADTIWGAEGDDIIDGQQGTDRCGGGPDADRIVGCET
ncbi:MAG: calcium-binding protein [Acidimicrobiia bacterium]|nr:calcium-binding protein [Acidimicrobiia bacterium]